MNTLTRRTAIMGAVSALGGCSAIASLNEATQALDTYELRPAAGSARGPRSARTLLIPLPQASAVLSTDRIMVKPDAASVTYLPDARWGDALPAVFQSLLIRSISDTGRIGYVGPAEGGPVPDRVILARIDAFEVQAAEGALLALVDINLTILNDRDQRVVASRRFDGAQELAGDDPRTIIAGFQTVLNTLLPAMADWAVQRA